MKYFLVRALTNTELLVREDGTIHGSMSGDSLDLIALTAYNVDHEFVDLREGHADNAEFVAIVIAERLERGWFYGL